LDYVEKAKKLREDGIPTVPTTVAMEKATNPFMRAATAKRLGEIRAAKDAF
jgi:hydroxyacylglutathione hydrolase